ncbi:rac GTPase-activating protein [Anopheles darlingi]|uniref:Rac GTPase-activating protein n=1 Tax=Anopheles darlingi TaxID=43151 RepID=W5J5S6_ANODA|nr:rac GTPase-activating protein [Anopheles darlingi]
MSTELSLVAQFDELRRSSDVLRDGAAEVEFLRFVQLQDQCRMQWLKSIDEAQRLQREVDNALRSITNLESKLCHARKLLETETKARRLAEKERDTMEHKMMAVCDIVRNEHTLRDETRVRLAEFATESRRRSRHAYGGHHEGEMTGGGGGGAVDNDINSTGSFLVDLSLTQSEDDFLEPLKMQAKRKSWKKHRPSFPNNNNNNVSFTRPPVPEAKHMETTTTMRKEDYTHSGEGQIIAHAKVTVPTGTDGGPIMAESTFRTTAPQLLPPLQPVSCASSNSTAATIVNAAPTVEPKETPKKTVIQRNHELTGRTFIAPETCNHCQQRIRFGSSGLRCRECKAVFHSHCRETTFACVPLQSKSASRRGTSGVATAGAGSTPLAPPVSGALGDLEDYCPQSSPRIPALIVHCVSEIENRGLTEVGLYRVSATDREVRSLKEKFLRGKSIPTLGQIDVHVLCGCIKDFLRTLREPLIPASMLPEFTRIVSSEPQQSNPSTGQTGMSNRTREQLCQLIEQMPAPNRDTLAFLMLHFQRIAQSACAKMPVENLARVFAPTICGYSRPDLTLQETFAETCTQFNIVNGMLHISTDYWSRFIMLQWSSSDGENVPPQMNAQRTGQQPAPMSKSRSQETPILRRPRKDRKYYATPPYKTSKDN